MIPRNHRGITLLEVLIVAAIVGLIAVVGSRLFVKNVNFMKRIRVRQQVLVDARSTMDTILLLLRDGKARTLTISTPAAIPNARVDFTRQTGNKACSIYLANGTVYVQDGTLAPHPLASNVTSLMFSGDSRDPTLLSVSLRIDAPVDPVNDPDQVATIILPGQMVNLVDVP